MIYKEFGYEDFKSIVTLWNNNIGILFPMDERLFAQNFLNEKNRRKALAAFDGEEIAGFIIYKQWTVPTGENPADNSVGYINSAVVDYKYRGRGIGKELFKRAEEDMRLWGVKVINIGRDTFHFFPGLPAELKSLEFFLTKRGYKAGASFFDMICDISSVELDKLPGVNLNCNSRYSIGEIRHSEMDELLRFLKDCFSGRWFYDKQLFIELGMEDRDIIVLRDGARIIGFCHIYDCRSKIIGSPIYWRGLLGDNYGGLGPIGIDPQYRKEKLGVTLLYKSLEILKGRNVGKMAIDWTQLVDFYGIFNFVPWKEYKSMSKMI